VALGVGAKQAIEARITAAGANMIIVRAGNRTIGGVRLGMGASSRLTAADADALRRLSGVRYVSAGLRTRQQVVANGANWGTSIEGCGAEMALIRGWRLAAGSFFGAADIDAGEPVAVLGSSVRDQLFGAGAPAVGATLRVGIVPMRAIGVLRSRGNTEGGQDQDDAIYVPYTVAQKRLMGVTYLDRITIGATAAEAVPVVSDEIARTLRIRHDIVGGAPDDFRVRNLEAIADIRSAGAQTMTWLLAGIAAISLLVGGVGIMNIMLVAVTERTHEIGIRAAVGARSRDLLLQFLVEAGLMAGAGGLGGVLLGILAANALTAWYGWPTSVVPEAIALAFSSAAAIGLVFGVVPARRAAALDPIDALRFE